jgi:hypothetical protein
MKERLIISVLCLGAISLGLVGFAFTADTQADENPCKDATYLTLKAKDVNILTQREYDVFKIKDTACIQYQQNVLNNKSQEKNTKVASKSGNGLLIALVIISLIPLAIYAL